MKKAAWILVVTSVLIFDLPAYSAGWYVNDTYSATSDSYTYAGGSDTAYGDGSASKPYRTVTKALSVASAGDAIFIDAGFYPETVVINVNSISLIGKDSNATVIDPPGAKTLSNLYGIYASVRTGLLIKNLGVTGAYYGIYFFNVDNSSIISDSVSSCGENGIYLLAGSDSNTVIGNTANFNVTRGIHLSQASFNTVKANTADTNLIGIELHLSTGNTIHSNRASSNLSSGIDVSSSSNNLFIQNEISGNYEYQIWLWDSSSSNTFMKNNIIPSTQWRDSAVFNNTNNAFDFTRNWWGTTDEITIDKRIADTASNKKIAFRPYRLGPVDTSGGADTTAPLMPRNVSAAVSGGQITIAWTIPTNNEETNGGSVGYAGAKIYRLTNRLDTTNWANVANLVWIASSTATSWTDTTATAGNTYYYRLTSFDAATHVNQSWFTDTVSASSSGTDTSGFAFIRRGVANPPPQSVFGAVSDMPVLQIVMGPKNSGTLTSVKITMGGTGNDATGISASGAKLWQDGDGNGTGDTQVGSNGTVTGDNGTVTFSGLTVSLTKDKPLYLVVTYSFAGTATAGQTFYAQIASTSDLTATTATSATFKFDGLPVTGDPVTAVSSLNTVPSTPTPGSPADNATGVAPNGEVTISGYSDANGDTHKCTHWQVSDSTQIFDNMHMRVNVVIPAETAGLRFKFPRGLLRGAQKHYWRARFCDARGGWSSWSTTRNFTTATETLAITPTAAKTLDSNPFSRDTRPIGFKLKNGGDEKFTTLGGVKFEDEVSDTGRNQKPSTSFKFGLIAFTCEGVSLGGTITISLNMPESVPVTAKYFIFDAANGWLDMSASLTSHDGDSEVFLTLTDGGTGDLDGVANGVVVDPGGFEISDGSSSSSSGDATIKYPAACILQRIFNLPVALPVFRSVRDRLLDSSWGRKLTNFYYR